MILFHAYVSGTPRPQPRPRFVRGRVVSTASKLVKLWRGLCHQEFRRVWAGAPALTGAVKVDLTFSFKGPEKRWGKPHAIRPDGDNLAKGCWDILVRAGVLRDDSLVCGGQVTKVWARAGGVEVKILPADPVADDGDLGALVLEE